MSVSGNERGCVGYTSCSVDTLVFQNVCDKEEEAAVFADYDCVVGAVAFPEYSAMEWAHSYLASLLLYRTDGTKGVLSFPLGRCSAVSPRGIYINGTVYGSLTPGDQNVLLYRDAACAGTETYAQQYGVTYNAAIAVGSFGKSMAVHKNTVLFYADSACRGDEYRVTVDLCREGPWLVGNQTYSYASTFQMVNETQMEIVNAPPLKVELDCGDYEECSVGIMEFFDGDDCKGNSSFLLTDAPQCLQNSAYKYPLTYMGGVDYYISPPPGTAEMVLVFRDYNKNDRHLEFSVSYGCTRIVNLQGNYNAGEYWQIDGTSYYSIYVFAADYESDGYGDRISWEFYTDTSCTMGASPTYLKYEVYTGVYTVDGPFNLVTISAGRDGRYGYWRMAPFCEDGGYTDYDTIIVEDSCNTALTYLAEPLFQVGGVAARSVRYTRNTTTHEQVLLTV
eukprot:CAMPEP_0119132610 /NCGR_PEP_ID=MMETSP1310-20130426/11921_1 /TAXON_ID=464262 /ORGANISM="Genus nov. species nov., Strain RCC2339" /LENGTH=447 /DNA_ID=CAMNT_0007123247 /DNA_START=189 /DNA_END=1532 /DNA_ORIENTATION=-